jgi:hypothetical protein
VTTRAHPERRLLIAADLESYGRQNNPAQQRSQEVFRWAMTEAARAVGLNHSDWIAQPSGDGELAILPATTPEPIVVSGLAPALNRLLREHNHDLPPNGRSRMRIAMHVGLVHLDGANGYPGEAVVTVSRLVDAPVLKWALASCPSAAVALIVSDVVYRDVVANGYEGMQAENFVRTAIDQPDKAFSAVGWVNVPDEDIRWLGDTEAARALADQTAPATFSFNNVQMNGPTAIGDHSRAWTGPQEA